ncbi:Z1 domain-containing protein [Cytobacillus gottheilii]|uniref:Z1 domain-containing protein n=1 Tax=Cytobacillus gottheilii TaxID=859144 RepID=A0ABX8FF32_9BACI|nr:Z1 domain-containing protein [Cytobacillus gottheilii]QVY62604.1 Z1 domain-containing protein [Cytobacillus gottheilii]
MSAMDNKSLFEQAFTTNYYMLKSHSANSEEAAEKALDLARLLASGIAPIDNATFQKWSLEMFMKYKVGFEVPKDYVMRNSKEKSWFEPKMAASGFFWTRYRRYLSDSKNWPLDAVTAIDETTNQIMASIGNPKSMEPFDKRGLVLGYVQSGKTANFTGLINKAYDVGYKLIIVLSGIHNDLRAQTQIRLNEEVIGNRTDKDGNPIGVAQIYANTADHIISSWTTEDNDIKSSRRGTSNLNSPTLMVVKKNKTVLESLRDQLINHRDIYNLDIPVLIVDDEADQASVDTSNPDKNEDPKTINRLIRQILEVFKRKAFVGYTATPFANLLISKEGSTDEEGDDLYPKDFLVGLPKPKEYCGPEEYFNVEEDADDTRPSLIRHLQQEDLDVFTTIKKKSDADKFEEVPPQMREAMLEFLLVIAIRNLRGQRRKHNSMLIHTSRFKDVQSSVKDEVSRAFDAISKQLQYNPESSVIAELQELYENDILPTSRDWPNEDHPEFSWNEVYEELRKCCESIQVFEINGNSRDALDYHQYKEDGLNVIAVGGDKLSRGLTLEGLSITYYFRNTLMYDTLMQMGRWFGYRKGYMDLCRIYTSEEIASNFEHLAIAMIQLRQEFDRLAAMKKTPSEYAVKMLSHPTMKLTSPLKMRNAVSSNVIYAGTLQQTRLFDPSEEVMKGNMDAAVKLVNKIPLAKTTYRKTSFYSASDVNAEHIKEFLSDYQTADSNIVNSVLIADYIDRVNKEGELTDWTVAVVEGEPKAASGLSEYPVALGKVNLNSANALGNKVKAPESKDQIRDIKAIVSPNHEYMDLDYEEIKGIKDRMEKRRMRDKEKGLMLIYPLHPEVQIFNSLEIEFSSKLVPIGIAFSFPPTEIEDKGVYQTNKTV